MGETIKAEPGSLKLNANISRHRVWDTVDLDHLGLDSFQKDMKYFPTPRIIRVRPGPNTIILNMIHCPSICVSAVKGHVLDAGAESKQEDEVGEEDETEVPSEEKAENEECAELSEEQKNQPNSVGQNIPTTEQFQDLVGDPVKGPKDKSTRRSLLNWMDGVVHDYYSKKIMRTYVRENEERDQLYPPNFYFFYQETRGQRERQKREIWLSRDQQRQNMKDRLDSYREKKREAKEDLRQKEEERYEKWTAKHNTSIPDSPQGGPKKRMSLWEKRVLNAKEFLTDRAHFTNNAVSSPHNI